AIAEIGAANLFFAFDDDMQIHREIAGGLDLLLHSENVWEDLTCVVGRAASEDVTVFQNRLEWRRIPEPDGIGRLDVVVTINQNRVAARLLLVVRSNHGMARCGASFGGQTELSQILRQPTGTVAYFLRVMSLS